MRAVRSILIFSFAFLLTAVLFELLLKFGGILAPIVRIDSNKGERYSPDETCCSIFVSEGFGLSRTNSQGWFGKEFKDDGPRDISVAVIGNSWVASRQVFYRDNFLSIAEKTANGKIQDEQVSLFNFGKEDLPLKEMLYIKEEIASNYNPDKILILLNNGSFRDDSHRYVAYYNFINNKFQLDTSFKKTTFVRNFIKFELFTKSSVVFLANRVKNRLPKMGEIILDKFYFPSEKINSAEKESTPEITGMDKAIIEELARDKRVIFLLNLDESYSSIVKPLIGRSPLIDLRPLLLKMQAEGGIDPYFWNITKEKGHWNIQAHKAIGQKIAACIVELLDPKHPL